MPGGGKSLAGPFHESREFPQADARAGIRVQGAVDERVDGSGQAGNQRAELGESAARQPAGSPWEGRHAGKVRRTTPQGPTHPTADRPPSGIVGLEREHGWVQHGAKPRCHFQTPAPTHSSRRSPVGGPIPFRAGNSKAGRCGGPTGLMRGLERAQIGLESQHMRQETLALGKRSRILPAGTR